MEIKLRSPFLGLTLRRCVFAVDRLIPDFSTLSSADD
jgi:hypothetical protein